MIFNKNDNGLDEMQEHCPFISGSMDFEDFRSDVIFSTEELEKTVGADVIDTADAHYLSVNYKRDSWDGVSDEDKATYLLWDEIVFREQRCLAYMAYRDFSINNDLKHGKGGRRAALDKDNEQMAWEWMIERDDNGLIQKSNRAIDSLIKCLDVKKVPEWTSSAVFQETRELFLWNADLFHKVFPIDHDRRLFVVIAPFIKNAQVRHIKPVILSDYDELLESVKSNNTTDEQRDLLEYVYPPLALFAMVTAYDRLSVKLLPEGLVQQFVSSIQSRNVSLPPAPQVKAAVISRMKEDAEKELQALVDYKTKLEKEAAGGEVSDDDYPSVADRMDEDNLFVSV